VNGKANHALHLTAGLACHACGRRLDRHAVENLAQADALLFGRVTYEDDGGSVADAGADGSEA
jgi:hypothetical protein